MLPGFNHLMAVVSCFTEQFSVSFGCFEAEIFLLQSRFWVFFTAYFCLVSGNVAWMHILAARALRERPDTLGGEAFYCYDDSPYKSYEEFNMQFLSTFNFRRIRIPLLVLWLLAIVNDLLRWILSPVCAFTPLLNRYTYATVSTSFTVSTDKASRHFQYRPLYSWDQCKARTQEWVNSFAQDKAKGL